MHRRWIALFLGLLALPLPALAQNQADDFVSFRSMTVELAMELATATLKSCRDGGYQVSVAVVDRAGIIQVLLRDRFAGPHTPETARRKAWTAVTFRTNTTELAGTTQAGQPQSGARHIDGALMLGGGLMVESQGQIVGGIGISGAPGGDLDDACGKAGIEAVADRLEPL